ncbi:lysophospholipase L1-like esterase [Nitrospina gracilis]|uniref:tetratricopeptide repeat protein n=1 Tax=Nitrospina TaxID=35800 RepID=UPI001650D7ED|nr:MULTISPECIES: tetratricopeptide repeat protein [Nitrospina]MCF8724438.1 lysophospholipase L1-like esterase [Nitrospina sp. Nb-3]
MLLLEGGLRLGGFGDQFEFVITGTRPQDEGKVSLNTQYVALHYFQHLPVNIRDLFTDQPWYEDTEFSRKKQPGVYRIFMVGASTTRGFPYTDRRISYSGLLQGILNDVLPGRRVEVINAGYDALSSFGVLDLTSQLMDYEPDLLIVYSGHNEFIGHFGVNSAVNYGQNREVIRLATFLFHSRVYLALERASLWLKSRDREKATRESQVNLFRAMLSRENMVWDEPLHAEAERNYKANLKDLVQKANKRGIQVLLLTLVSNLRDFSPIRSGFSETISAGSRTLILESAKRGRDALKEEQYEKALKHFQAAHQQDEQYAEAHYGIARAYDQLNQMDKARFHYLQAREHDRLHLRACLRFHQIVKDVGAEEGGMVLDLAPRFERVSAKGLPGEGLFLEHVHPNINGHMVIADSIARFLAKQNLIASGDQWKWDRLRPAREYVLQAGFDQSQYLNAQYTIGRLYLEFPFYKCEKGVAVLEEIGKAKAERSSIDNCFQISRKENSNHVD